MSLNEGKMSLLDDTSAIAWTKLVREDAIAEGELRLARMGVRQVFVTKEGGTLRVFKNACPHAGAPLSGGHAVDGFVVCPRHQWQFRLSDGSCPAHPIYSLRGYDVKVEDGWVWASEGVEEIW